KVAEYSGEDADVDWRLTELLEKQLEEVSAEREAQSAREVAGTRGAPRSTLRTLYDDVELPLIEVLAELEFNGIRIDAPLLNRLSWEMAGELLRIEKEIYGVAGHDFNIASPKQLRQAFLPEEGWLLLTADYSQIELRLLAHFCGDEHLRQAFAEEQDIHAVVAAQVFGVPEQEVTPEMRRMAKMVNFGIVYGMSAH